MLLRWTSHWTSWEWDGGRQASCEKTPFTPMDGTEGTATRRRKTPSTFCSPRAEDSSDGFVSRSNRVLAACSECVTFAGLEYSQKAILRLYKRRDSASMSLVNLISSPRIITRYFETKLRSLRLIVPVASNPMIVLSPILVPGGQVIRSNTYRGAENSNLTRKSISLRYTP